MKLLNILLKPVDNTFLILFRIVFGTIAFIEAWLSIGIGWVHEVYVEPSVHFPFIGFEWLVETFAGKPMYAWYFLMGIAALGIALGWKFRFSAIVYSLLWTGSYLMQKVHYNNHFYLFMLISWVLPWLPANVRLSIDVRNKNSMYTEQCAAWCKWLFVMQIWFLYSYATIAKLNPDWLSIKPISIWFSYKKDYWLVGELLQKDWFRYVIAYGGIIFDGLVVPALLWNKTRKWAFILAMVFHGFNSIIFQIGSFPFMALSFSLFFFPSNVLRKVFFMDKWDKRHYTETDSNKWVYRKHWAVFTIIWLAVQMLLPLRHHLWEGDVNWSEEGHRLSWRMMLRSKTGNITFRILDVRNGNELFVSPNQELNYATATDIATHPDMCWQYVQHLKRKMKEKGIHPVAIYAIGEVSLNGRPATPLIDKTVDLAKVQWEPFAKAKWITDFNY